jgi:DNA-binding transcriptional MerR regulator
VIEAGDIESAVVRKPVKSEAAFRTISEVSDDLEVPQHVLRFWESKFPQIKPLKRGGGRRYYRPEDLHLLRHIRDLLYKDGYTIRGVQKLLRDQARGQAPTGADAKSATPQAQQTVTVKAAPAEIADKPFVQPELQLKVTPKKIGPSDLRAELNNLVSELDELRSLLFQARQGER